MSYGGFPYGGVAYAASDVAEIPQADTQTALSVEVAFTTGALETPVWEDITSDVRFWDVSRGRSRELERHQPGRATIVLSNLSRQYDSVYAAGPHFGNLRPMRRVRIRETFNGVTYPVFDGFVDRWELDYPAVGHDATATLTATDAFKVLNRTDLPVSVYAKEIADDAPNIWWRMGETVDSLVAGFALNSGSLGTAGNGTFAGAPETGSQGLVVHDPGSSLRIRNSQQYNGTPRQGVVLANGVFSLLSQSVFAVEAWVRLESAQNSSAIWTVSRSADSTVHAICGYETAAPSDRQFVFIVLNSTFTLFYGVVTPVGSALPGAINHVVASVESGGQMAIWLNGTRYTTLYSGATASSLSGVTRPTNGDFAVGHENRNGASAAINWGGEIDEVATYPTGLSSARIGDHYAAGTSPWRGDLPSERMDRVLDLVGYDLRELDPGLSTFQSANLEGRAALEHLQKAAETDFGLFYVGRDGTARFVDRSTQAVRQPGTAVYGDGAGEVGYRSIRPDDGDEVIRNSATISRYNGVAQTATGATIDEFGRFQYTLDGLLHDSDAWSAAYAQFIVDEYEEPRRRITELRIGPPKDGEEDLYLPAMLGPELGDAITVTHTPNGIGDPFEQVCVVEGITHTSAPGRNRTTTFALSPEFSEAPVIWQDWTPTLANMTLGDGTIVARYAQIGKTVHFTFRFTLGSTSAIAAGVSTFSLPVTAASTMTDGDQIAHGKLDDASSGDWLALGWLRDSRTTCRVVYLNASVGFNDITATAPFTWTTSDIIILSGTYEAA